MSKTENRTIEKQVHQKQFEGENLFGRQDKPEAEKDRTFSLTAPQYLVSPLFYFLKRYWPLHLCSLVVSLIVALLEGLNVATIFPLLSSLFNVGEVTGQSSFLIARLDRAIDVLSVEDRVLGACVLLILLALLKFAAALTGECLAAHGSSRIVAETKKELLQKYYKFPYIFFLEHKLGDLKHIVMYSTQRLSFCVWAIPLWVTEFFKIVALLGLLMFLDLRLTLYIVGGGFVFYAVVAYISRKVSFDLGKLASNKLMEQANLLDECLEGVKHISVFGVFSHWLSRFSHSSKRQADYHMYQGILTSLPKHVLEFAVMSILFGAIVFLRLSRPYTWLEDVPLTGLFAMALLKMLPPLGMLSRNTLDLMAHLNDVLRVYGVLTAPSPAPRRGGKNFASFRDSIVFEEIHFGYPNREPLLKGVNLTFRKNQVTAIVGRSGEGKTTLVNLLLGLYEPQKGCIRIDGVDLREYDTSSVRSRIGFVSQDPFTIHATVAENIAFGEEKFSREEIIEGASLANADEFISKLPEGYDTVVGERGMKLSGGQQQRIAIARAVLRKPEILIFDEATSSLDNLSEKLVQEAISRISTDRTVVVIAHRTSTIQNADKIVVLHAGVCVEEGTHDELMQSNGVYRNQVSGEVTDAA